MRGLLLSHLLASVCGGLVLAGVLLGFGVIGKQRTETVPINDYSATPPASASGSIVNTSSNQIYLTDETGVVSIRARLDQSVTSPFIANPEPAGSTSTGSGFLVSGTGYIITSAHVIAGADPTHGIIVVFNAEYSRRAAVVSTDTADDVAVLKVDSMKGLPADIQPLSFGDSRTVVVGDTTYAIANPFGSQRTISSGIISALQPALIGVGATIDNVIQTDLQNTAGLSGAPLLDGHGHVIGLNSQIRVDNGGSGYLVSFAVPIRTIEDDPTVPKGVLP
jgi:S1-C subfamily serine protease